MRFAAIWLYSHAWFGRLRADIADVVVGRAELVGLGEVAEYEADDEAHRGQKPADRGGAKRHAAILADPRTAGSRRQRVQPARRELTLLDPQLCTEGSGLQRAISSASISS